MSHQYDEIIRAACQIRFPELETEIGPPGWLWIKAQMWQESRFDPLAVSPAGAQGLLQLMPATAREMGCSDPFDPALNIRAGVSYLDRQFQRLGEIPCSEERLRFALAAYNGGRGYINEALKLARQSEKLPGDFTAWNRAGRPVGDWQSWDYASRYLADPRCAVRGKTPDHRQMCDYVDKISQKARIYIETHPR